MLIRSHHGDIHNLQQARRIEVVGELNSFVVRAHFADGFVDLTHPLAHDDALWIMDNIMASNGVNVDLRPPERTWKAT